MKTFFNKPAALMITAALFLLSCSKSPVDPLITPGTPPTVNEVTAALTSGSWKVSSYIQKTEDKTSKFNGFVFVFTANGTVSATKGGNATSGTWQYTPAVTYYGSTSKSAIALGLGSGDPYNLLTKTWNLESSSSTDLKVISPEITEDEHVQFSKL